MKKIIGLTIAFLLSTAMLATGTWAYFQDGATSTTNSLTAGTLNLKTNDADGVTQTLYGTSIKANGTVGPSTITLKNSGSLNASYLDISFNYTESDGTPNTVNKTADQTAAVIEVTTLTYGVSNLLTSIIDSNVNGYKDVQDLNAGLTNQSGIDAGLTKDFTVTVKVRDGISNDFQGDGVTITMTFTLKQ